MGKVEVVVIPVDLGAPVSDIISQEIHALTAENRQQLDTLRHVAEATVRVRDAKVNQKQQTIDAIQSLLQQAESRLLAAGDVGVPATEIMALIRPLITTLPAFTLRMKTYLKEGGNKYIIARVKNNYLLNPYNLPQPL